MNRRFRTFLAAVTLLFAGRSHACATDVSALLDERSPVRQFDEFPLLAVTFLGVECPLARVYANRLNELVAAYGPRGVAFMAVDSNAHDDPQEIAAFARHLEFPMLRDQQGKLADQLGATRSPETFLLDGERRVIYRGRIDDQYEPGVHGRSAPTRCDLDEAIQEALANRPITVSSTTVVGCLLDRGPTQVDPLATSGEHPVSYARDVAEILDAHCAECHRPGAAAPFSLLNYEDAAAWSATIREVVDQRRMPPWGVRGGDFVNDRSLSNVERQTLFAWIDAGSPVGDLAQRPIPPEFADGWSIRADRVLTMQKPFEVPAEGVLDYQEFPIDPGFTHDAWVNAVEIRPGCPSVVHHINVYVKPRHALKDELFINSLGDYYLAMTVPGNTITTMPPGTAKRIPAGWQIVLSVHYVPNGVSQRDRSSVALSLCDASSVRQELATRALLDDHLVIGPHERKVVTHTWTCEDDFTLFALYPHMHLRGSSMLFEASYPDGRREVLLDVDRYDFTWQYRYVLRTPTQLPRGTVVTATAVYDNTAQNKNNPDPAATVRAGRQTTDEMFQACFEICRTHENRLAAGPRWLLAAGWTVIVAAAAIGIRRWLAGNVIPIRVESRQSTTGVAG